MTESISVFFGVEDYSSLSASCIGGRASTGVEFAEGGRKRMSASPLGSHWTSNFLGFSVPAATSQLGSLLRPSRVGDERGERRKGGDRRSVGEALMLSLAAKTAALSGIVGTSGILDSSFVDSSLVDLSFVDWSFADSSFVDSSFVDSSLADWSFADSSCARYHSQYVDEHCERSMVSQVSELLCSGVL